MVNSFLSKSITVVSVPRSFSPASRILGKPSLAASFRELRRGTSTAKREGSADTGTARGKTSSGCSCAAALVLATARSLSDCAGSGAIPEGMAATTFFSSGKETLFCTGCSGNACFRGGDCRSRHRCYRRRFHHTICFCRRNHCWHGRRNRLFRRHGNKGRHLLLRSHL